MTAHSDIKLENQSSNLLSFLKIFWIFFLLIKFTNLFYLKGEIYMYFLNVCVHAHVCDTSIKLNISEVSFLKKLLV